MFSDEFWKGLRELDEAFREADAELAEIVEKSPYIVKLAITQWVMKHIVEHAQEGGSYRYLIYDRLGFDSDAYVPLCADGLTISNEFDLNLKNEIIEALKNNENNKIRSILGVCDIDGCYDYVTASWPTNDGGYNRTCSNHYRELAPRENEDDGI